MTDTTDTLPGSADDLMSPREVISTIRATMGGRAAVRASTGAPASRVTINLPGSEGNTSHAPVGGAMLTDDEATQLAHEQAQTRSSRDFRTEITSLEQRLSFIDERLSTHTFDPVTGEKIYTLFGRDRETVESERASIVESIGIAARGLPQAEKREAEAKAAQDARDAEDAVIYEAAGGDRRKAQMIRDEMDRIGARQIAEWIMARRQR